MEFASGEPCTITCTPPPPPPPPPDCFAGPDPACTAPPAPGSLLHAELITKPVTNITSIADLCKLGLCLNETSKSKQGSVKGATPNDDQNTSAANLDNADQETWTLLQPIKDQGVQPDPEPDDGNAGSGNNGGSLPTSDGACEPDDGGEWVDPNTINFSQRTISPNNYAELMRQGLWDWNRPGTALRVIDVGGQLVTYDNRRLDAAREVGDPALVERVNPGDPYPLSTTGKTWWDKFKQRFNDPRNKAAGGCVPETGLNQRPDRTPGK